MGNKHSVSQTDSIDDIFIVPSPNPPFQTEAKFTAGTVIPLSAPHSLEDSFLSSCVSPSYHLLSVSLPVLSLLPLISCSPFILFVLRSAPTALNVADERQPCHRHCHNKQCSVSAIPAPAHLPESSINHRPVWGEYCFQLGVCSISQTSSFCFFLPFLFFCKIPRRVESPQMSLITANYIIFKGFDYGMNKTHYKH